MIDLGTLGGALLSEAIAIAAESTGISERIKQVAVQARLRSRMESYVVNSLADARSRYTYADEFLIDTAFVDKIMPKLLAQLLLRSGRPSKEALVDKWITQFGFELTLAQITKASDLLAYFLDLVDRKLRNDEDLQLLYDSRALDAISDNTQVLADEIRMRRLPKVRLYMFRQHQAFTLHDVPQFNNRNNRVKTTLIPLISFEDTEVLKDVNVPVFMDRWKKRSKDDVLWHLILDNVGDDLENDISVDVRLADCSFLHLEVNDVNDKTTFVKSLEGGRMAMGSLLSFEVTKLLPRRKAAARIVTTGPEIPTAEFWCQSGGWQGPSAMHEIRFSIPM